MPRDKDLQVEDLAIELASAQESGEMVASLPSSRSGFDLDLAYAIESKLKDWREAQGQKAVGRKVGYANKAMWRVLKLETLVWGHMYDDTVHYTENDSADLHIAHPRSLKIEPEIVFGLKQPLLEASDGATALAAVDWLALGFELIDCPYPDWKFQPSDFVASYGLHATLVVGSKIPVKQENFADLIKALGQFKVRMKKGAELIEEGSGKNSLKNPALCLAELASAIARRFPNDLLREGEIVSTGTLTAGHLTAIGDEWTAEPEGIVLPPLSLRLK